MAKEAYSQKLRDPRWQKMRLRVFERDDFTCRMCGETSKTLHAHHANYHPLSEGPWDYDLDTLFTLCADCHSDEHETLGAAKANLINQLIKKGFWTSCDLELLSTIFEHLNTDDLERVFLKNINGD